MALDPFFVANTIPLPLTKILEECCVLSSQASSSISFSSIFVVGCLHLIRLSVSFLRQVFYSYGEQKRLSFHTRSSLALKAFTVVVALDQIFLSLSFLSL